MGLNSDIKAKILGTYSPGCYHQGTITIKNAVRITDLLVNMYHRRGPEEDNTFTGDEAYQSFLVPIKNALALDEYVYAIVCDNQQGVPHQKKMTQDDRRKADTSYAKDLTASHPGYVTYPNECEINDQGICRPKVDDKEPMVERMILDEVVKNSCLRLKLMHYFCGRLAELVIPMTRVLRFDYDYRGPWYFMANEAPKHCIERGTNLGEYDIAANHIASEYCDYPIILQTADTDTIPLVTSLVASGRFKEQIAWIFAPGGYVDCHRMVLDSLQATGMDARMFILACVLCGTDFYKKTWLSHFFNDDAIFSALRHPHCAASLVGFESSPDGALDGICNFVLWLHTARLDSTVIDANKRKRVKKASDKAELMKSTAEAPAASSYESDEAAANPKKRRVITHWEAMGSPTVQWLSHRNAPLKLREVRHTVGKRYKLPSYDELVNAADRVRFNVWYWTQHWRAPKERYEQWRAALKVSEVPPAATLVGVEPNPGPSHATLLKMQAKKLRLIKMGMIGKDMTEQERATYRRKLKELKLLSPAHAAAVLLVLDIAYGVQKTDAERAAAHAIVKA